MFAQLSDKELAEIDSLQEQINGENHDTIKINSLIAWDNLIYFFDPKLDSSLNQQIIEISESNLEKTDLNIEEKQFYMLAAAKAYGTMGLYLVDNSNYDEAFIQYETSVSYFKKMGKLDGLDAVYCNMGSAYHYMGDFDNAIKYLNLTIKLSEKTGNVRLKGAAMLALGDSYSDIGYNEEAKNYFDQAIAISKECGDDYGVSIGYSNLGNLFLKTKKYTLAKEMYQKSIELDLVLNNYYGLGSSYSSLGECMLNLNNPDSAKMYFDTGLAYRKQLDDTYGLCFSYAGLAKIHNIKGDQQKALEYAFLSKEMGVKSNALDAKLTGTQILFQMANEQGKFKLAFENFEEHFEYYKDVTNSNNQRKMVRQDLHMEYEKKKLADSISFLNQQELSRVQHKADIDKKNQEQKMMWVGIGFLLVMGALILRGYQRKKKDNTFIAEQKKLVEHAHKEITDSIAYAKRIQSAILPSPESFSVLIPKSFVFYQPKDVVAGDFYWIEEAGNEILFAVADCTGHGVPGAMVSVICNNGESLSPRIWTT